ncbi:MAG: protein kinase [Burkholderiales bacterium]|nr:protein kinase [Burkholderiales bacterium]
MGAEAARHARLKQLFMAVADLAGRAPRQAALDAAGASPDEQAAVWRLLDASDRTTHFSGPISRASSLWLEQELPMGSLLGAWRLVRPLGEGGMGRVCLAERADGAYAQHVAVKLVRVGSGPEALARFAHERQILAGLNHPHIARLLDGGQTPQGSPFLVMEYVDGEVLDDWCERKALDFPTRLALFDTLCEAVAYAHRRLVIHFDIKPANVLVDQDGRLRLLDFGVAQIEGEAADGPVGLTPAYASPEQAAGQAPGVASDIYSLGRVLDVLTRALTLPAGRRAELDAIVAKSTAGNPAQRYGDVASLQQDLRRLLRRQPVQAMGYSRSYVLRKWLQRHWPWALAASALLAAGGAFTWRLALERDRAVAAEQRALDEARTASEVSDFLVNLFNDANDSEHERASEVRALTLLERGHERLMRDLADRPQQRALLLARLGRVLEDVSQNKRATELYGEAIEAYRLLGQPQKLTELYNALAFSLNRLGQFRRALRVIEDWQQHAPLTDGDVANIDNAFGTVLANLGRTDEARARMVRALASVGQAPDHPDLPRLTPRSRQFFSNLALVELAARRPDEAERLSRLSLDPTHAAAYRRHNVLALALMDLGQTEAALEHMRLADAEAVRRFGKFNATRHRVLRDQGWLLMRAGRLAEAERTLRLALQCAEESGEADQPSNAMTLSRLAEVLAARGHRGAALHTYDDALRIAIAYEADGDPVGLARIRASREALLSRRP